MTPFITPTMLLSSGMGLDWKSYPDADASAEEVLAAQTDVCWAATSAMAMEANQELRATVNTEVEFGPDRTISIRSNGWARMQLSRWPVLQILSASVSGALGPPQWTAIPLTSLITEHSALPPYGSIVPDGAGQGPNSILIAPGFVSWWGGRNGTMLQMEYLNGWPIAGIDQAVVAGATSCHVDDITGWWNGTAGAMGVIYDPPWREAITILGATPDIAGAVAGPGRLTTTPFQFAHTPVVGQTTVPDQTVLLSTMPRSLIQAGLYFGTHYGLIRGAQAAVIATPGGQVVVSGTKVAQDWYEKGKDIMVKYARAVY